MAYQEDGDGSLPRSRIFGKKCEFSSPLEILLQHFNFGFFKTFVDWDSRIETFYILVDRVGFINWLIPNDQFLVGSLLPFK